MAIEEKPRVRYVDAFPVDIEGRKLIYLRDPEGLAPSMAVPGAAYFLMTLMDGTQSIPDLQGAFARQFQDGVVSQEEIGELVSQLDEACLLDNERSHMRRGEMEAKFRAATIRPAAHAGQSYPDDPNALREMIDGFFDAPEGPGRPGGVQKDPIKALMAPHIDFQRGGPCFAWAYKALAEAPPPDVFVVLGTGHAARQPFVMSRKDFETPFGTLKADRTLIDRIADAAAPDVFDDEYAHKEEHSLEFQAVFLKYLYPHRDISFVPILCGSFHDLVELRQSPMSASVISDFVAALKGALGDSGKSVCLISGVDFSHVGPRFGDGVPLSDDFIAGVEQVDRALLKAVETLDAEAYFDVVIREGDRTRVCGTSSIYTMLNVLDANRSELLKYDQAIDRQTQQMVSFASMAFY